MLRFSAIVTTVLLVAGCARSPSDSGRLSLTVEADGE